jgi:DNA-directed RNA polymerase subunit E'/Rpb7
MKSNPIRQINSLKDAQSIGNQVFSQLKSGEPTEYKREVNGIRVEYPEELKDPLWNISKEALFNTLHYIFNIIHHQCYLVCIANQVISMYRLSDPTIGKLYENAIAKAKQNIDKNKNIEEAQKKFIKSFKPIRVMQCVIKNRISQEKDNNEYLDLLKRLLLPDGLFIFNLTDAVILRKDGRHPFPMVVGNIQLDKAKSYLPIFTMSRQIGYKDIPMPNYDELKWVYDSSVKDTKYDGFITEWDDKSIGKAVFRGGPTGCGYTVETNMRLKLYTLATDNADLDVQLSGKEGTIDTRSVRFDPKYGLGMLNTKFPPADKFLTMAEQSNYKYLIHIDGNVNAYRMLYTMSTGSLLLRVESEYKSWAEQYMKKNIHYISIASDLSNLNDVIRWCKINDKKCKEIAQNGMKLARSILTPEFIDNYFQMLFSKFSDKTINKTVGFKTFSDYKQNRKILEFKPLPEQDPMYHPVKVAIIIPHRNRIDNLNKFITHFNKYELQDNSLDVYIIDQNNNEKFNRGLLLNIGFSISRIKHYDRYIFHDVDTYPDIGMFELYFRFIDKNIHYTCPGHDNIKYNFYTFFGGVSSFTESDFDRINGFPNTFFGWGKEDDALYNRTVANNVNFYRPDKTCGRFNLENHPPPTENEKLDNKRGQQAVLDDLIHYKDNGVHQLSQLNITISPMEINSFISEYEPRPTPLVEPIILRDFISEEFESEEFQRGNIEYFPYKIDFVAKHENLRDIIETLPTKKETITLVEKVQKEPEKEIISEIAPEVIRNDIYSSTTLIVNVSVPFENVGRDMEKYFEAYSRENIEGRCNQDGYVRPLSTKIITYTAGIVKNNIAYYKVLYMFDVFYPYEGLELECLIKFINKIGIQANFGDRNNPAEIYVTREHNQNVDFDGLEINKKIRIKVIGHRYELNDKFISILGEMM